MSPVLLSLFLLLLLLPQQPVEGQSGFSSLVPCPEALPAEPGQRVCYNVAVDEATLTCDADLRSAFPKNINFRRSQAKIYSPGTRGQDEYRDRQICNYNAFCAPDEFLHYQILTPFFELENEMDGQCVDFIDVINLDGICEPPIIDRILCGELPQSISCRRPGNINLDFDFRSNDDGVTFNGFRMDLICASTESVNRRRKRQVPSTVFTTAVATTTSRIRVPRSAFISYDRQVIKVISSEDGRVISTFRSNQRLFFWTAFDGVEVFVGSAPSDSNIFGGGILNIIKNCAYYTNHGIPPELEPTAEELEILQFLLNATEPFFLSEQDLDDDPPPDNSTTPPPMDPTRPPRPPYRYYGKRSAHLLSTQQNSMTRQSDATRRFFTRDLRVSKVALNLAIANVNATNIFVRASAVSFLGILEDEDIEILRKK